MITDLRKSQSWECKDCHDTISDEESVAYRLVDGILYGWCVQCFENRPQKLRVPEETPAECSVVYQ